MKEDVTRNQEDKAEKLIKCGGSKVDNIYRRIKVR